MKLPELLCRNVHPEHKHRCSCEELAAPLPHIAPCPTAEAVTMHRVIFRPEHERRLSRQVTALTHSLNVN